MLVPKPLLIAACALFALVIVAFGGYLLYTFGQRSGASDPQAVAQATTDRIVESVGAHMYLPDENPTVATVTDLEKLKGQPFFVGAKLGYKVLIYTLAKKAILYDPVGDRIVEVAPLSTDITP